MEPAALLVLVCCQPQPPASSSSSLSKLLPPSWQWMHAAAGLQGPRPACSTSLATRAPQALCKQAARSAPLAAQRRFQKKWAAAQEGHGALFLGAGGHRGLLREKTKVVGLVEMSRLVQVYQHASHALSPSASLTALCERLRVRTPMTTRCLPPVDVQGAARGGALLFTGGTGYEGSRPPGNSRRIPPRRVVSWRLRAAPLFCLLYRFYLFGIRNVG